MFQYSKNRLSRRNPERDDTPFAVMGMLEQLRSVDEPTVAQESGKLEHEVVGHMDAAELHRRHLIRTCVLLGAGPSHDGAKPT
jgi:hypothetical protein